jgi:hypothetical protein
VLHSRRAASGAVLTAQLPPGDCHHRRPSDLVLTCLNRWEKAYGKVFDHGASRFSTFTVGVSTLTGFKLSSLILHSDRDVLQMTPTEF